MTPEEFAFEVLVDVQYTAMKTGKPFFKSDHDRDDWGKDARSELKQMEEKALAMLKKHEKKQELVEIDPGKEFGDG